MANAWLMRPLPLPIVSVNAGGTSFGDPTYLANDYAGVVWASGSSTSIRLKIDLGADVPVDTLFLFGVVAPDGATLSVQAATSAQGDGFTTGTFYASPSQALFAGSNRLASGAGVALWSPPADGRPAVRYLRLSFALSTAGVIQLGRIVAGARIALGRNFSFGAAFGARDLGSLDFSTRGVLLRHKGAKLRTTSLTFSSATRDEVESAILPLVELGGNSDPVAIVTDPSANAMRERRCYFGPLVGDLSSAAVWRNAAAWEWKCNLVSLF